MICWDISISEVIYRILNPNAIIFVWSYGISNAKNDEHKVMEQVGYLSGGLSASPVNLK